MEICPGPVGLPSMQLRFAKSPRLFSTRILMLSPFRAYAVCANRRNKTDAVESESSNRMFMLGMGFVAKFFAADLKNQGWDVSGTCTSDSKKKNLREEGYNVYVFDAHKPNAIDTIITQRPWSEHQRKRLCKQYTSRVHVADICQALNATIHKPSPGKIYNIVDDDPAPRIEVFNYAWHLVEKKWLGWVKQPAPSKMSESSIPEGSSAGEKRVLNARMKKELGVTLLHPSYQSGLESIVEHMSDQIPD